MFFSSFCKYVFFINSFEALMSDVRMGLMLNWSTANCHLVGNITVGNKHANLSVKLLAKVQQAHIFSADLSLTFGLVQKVPTDCT